MFHTAETINFIWPWLFHLASIIGVLLALLLISQVLRSPRTPSVTLGWLTVIILLPIIGIPLYLALGARKFKTRINSKGKIRLPDTDDTHNHPVHSLLVSLGIPSSNKNNLVHFHRDGRVAWEELTALLEGAQKSIDIAIYILGDDYIGLQILSILEQKVSQGIKVRLLLDGVGSFKLPGKRLRPLQQQGGEVAWFIPVIHRPLRGRTNLRNHRKIVIVDEKKVFTGGRNFSMKYLGPDCPQNCWIDLSFIQQGPVVSTYSVIFEADWSFAAHTTAVHKKNTHSIEVVGSSRVQAIPSGPDVADDPIYAAILTACYEARHRILIATPYYVPDSGIQEALKLAALRGVEVDLILPAKSNHPLADIARNRYLRELSGVGVRIWWLSGTMLHAKAMVIDTSFAMAGSANLDIRSLFLNCEIMSCFYSVEDINWLINWFEKLCEASNRHYPQPAGSIREMIEGLTLLTIYQL